MSGKTTNNSGEINGTVSQSTWGVGKEKQSGQHLSLAAVEVPGGRSNSSERARFRNSGSKSSAGLLADAEDQLEKRRSIRQKFGSVAGWGDAPHTRKRGGSKIERGSDKGGVSVPVENSTLSVEGSGNRAPSRTIDSTAEWESFKQNFKRITTRAPPSEETQKSSKDIKRAKERAMRNQQRNAKDGSVVADRHLQVESLQFDTLAPPKFQGYLQLKNKNHKWKRRWGVLLSDSLRLYDDDMKLVQDVPLLGGAVKPQADKSTNFQLITAGETYSFSCELPKEMFQWVNMLGEVCESLVMNTIEKPRKRRGTHDCLNVSEEKNGEDLDLQNPGQLELQEIMKYPGNDVCVDCSAPDPDWASINLGVFICLQCSGVHRSLGSHISKVRSVNLDEWQAEAIQVMREIGNTKANKKWEHNLPGYVEKLTFKSSREEREKYINMKYVKRRFCEEEASDMISETQLKQMLLRLLRHDGQFRQEVRTILNAPEEEFNLSPPIVTPPTQLLVSDHGDLTQCTTPPPPGLLEKVVDDHQKSHSKLALPISANSVSTLGSDVPMLSKSDIPARRRAGAGAARHGPLHCSEKLPASRHTRTGSDIVTTKLSRGKPAKRVMRVDSPYGDTTPRSWQVEADGAQNADDEESEIYDEEEEEEESIDEEEDE